MLRRFEVRRFCDKIRTFVSNFSRSLWKVHPDTRNRFSRKGSSSYGYLSSRCTLVVCNVTPDHEETPFMKTCYLLLMLRDQTSLVAPSLMCSIAANYHLNYPRSAPFWPCSSVGRARVIRSGGRGFKPYGVCRDFFSSSLWPDFLSRAFALHHLGYLYSTST